MKNRIKWLCIAGVTTVLLSILVAAGPAWGNGKIIKIGVLAKRSAERCLEKWSPTAEYLSSAIPGETFMIVPLDFKHIISFVEKEKIDFVLTNPAIYVEIEHQFGAERIATLKNLRMNKAYIKLGGLVFRRADRNDIQRLTDLKGKTYMAADKKSFAGWIAVSRELNEKGIHPYQDFGKFSFAGTHDAVVYAVRDRQIDAGSVRTDTLERMAEEGKIDLKDFHVIHDHKGTVENFPFLHSTRLYPEWPMAKIMHIPNELAEKVAIALLEMPEDSRAAIAARCAGWTIPLNYQPVHECLKELKLGPYRDSGKITPAAVVKKYWEFILAIAILFAAVSLAVVFILYLNRNIKKKQIALLSEINEHKQTENKLRESEDMHRLLAENTVDCIWKMNMNMQFTYINQAIFHLCGFTPEEWTGSKLPEHCSPKEMGKMQSMIADTFADLPDKTSALFETHLYHKNGEEIPVEVSGKILLDDAKNPIGFQGTTRNITERRQAEKKLQESEERFRQIAEGAEEWIWEVDATALYTYASPVVEKLLGYKPEELVGKKHSHDLFHPDDHEPLKKATLELFAEKKPLLRFINRNIHKDGQILWLSTNGFPILDDKGNLLGYRGADTDITEHKRVEEEKNKLEAQLRQAQKMEAIGTLAGGIAHDFNNVLYAIIGYTELSIDAVPEASKARGNLQEVLKAADRAKDMIQQVLTFSRKTEKEQKPINIQSILKEAVKLIRTSLPSTIEIRQDIDADCGPVMADPTQIHEVIMNLGTNAYHAMREKGGVLGISLRQEEISSDDSKYDPDLHPGPYLKLIVEDTGHGIDGNIMEKIFDPYFTTKDVGEGTGMGLSVAHGIVKDHGGDIRVYSEPGKGTSFHVYLPVIETGTVEREIISAEPASTGTERILLVDDEETIVYMTQQILESLGYHVTPRTSSVEALEAFRARPDEFDLVITDMTMPNMTGAELAPRLLEIRSDIPIILCTGFSELMGENRAKAIGIRAYVMKPIVRDKIAGTIRKVLDDEIDDR